MSGPPRPFLATLQAPVVLHLRADWNDLEAAMDVAAPRAELAVLSTKLSADGATLRFEIITATDEPGHILATRDPRHIAREEDIAIVLSARIGRFGDPAREQKILDALASRLTQLHRKATSPQ